MFATVHPTLSTHPPTAPSPCSGSFFVREELSTGRQLRRGLADEALLAGVAASCLGFGTVFLLLACGVYLG